MSVLYKYIQYKGGGVEPGALLSLNRDSHSVVDFSTLSLNKNCFCPF